jgi:hypothetical protein
MTDPANLALVLLCHVEEMKQVSTVYQFQSIETGCQLGGRRWEGSRGEG